MTKVLQKERSAAEQRVADLKEERDSISNEILVLKDEISKQNLHFQRLENETNIFETKERNTWKRNSGILQLSED